MLKWAGGDNAQWFEASGVGESRGQMSRPTNGRMTSGFGYRRHPILGYRKMHSGIDFGAPHGAPIYAATDGVIAYAGRKGGYGNFVQVNHGGGLATGYGHMSRIVARPGQRVRQGQIIGYVGSTGLSTGPHLHYELYRNGAASQSDVRHLHPTRAIERQRSCPFPRATGKAEIGEARCRHGPDGCTVKKVDAPQREIDRISRAQANGRRAV